jgi:ABC-2 type transport system ATP-binding protein
MGPHDLHDQTRTCGVNDIEPQRGYSPDLITRQVGQRTDRQHHRTGKAQQDLITERIADQGCDFGRAFTGRFVGWWNAQGHDGSSVDGMSLHRRPDFPAHQRLTLVAWPVLPGNASTLGLSHRSIVCSGAPGSLVGSGVLLSTREAVMAAFALHTEGLTKRFGRVSAVEDLTFSVEPGEVFGFLGPNGAGKSTTIRMLLGLIRPAAGAAWIFGHPARDVRQSHRQLAYVPADVALWPTLTGAETLALLAGVGPGTDGAYRAELVRRFDLDLDKPGRTYSTGNRQKVALVAAFATRAPLLVLDEPTSGLDPLMENEFRRCVAEARDRGQSVLLSSHQLAEVEAVCDRVAILRSGRLVETASIAELRSLRRTVVEVSYRDTPPPIGDVPGVLGVESLAGSRLRFTLSGPPGPMLQALADADVTAVAMREPSLAEIFLDYYGTATR